MPIPTSRTPRDIAAEEYAQYFGVLPPFLYIGHFSDAEIISLIEAALRSGIRRIFGNGIEWRQNKRAS